MEGEHCGVGSGNGVLTLKTVRLERDGKKEVNLPKERGIGESSC